MPPASRSPGAEIKRPPRRDPPRAGATPPITDAPAGTLGVWALLASLLGFLTVALLLYEFKFHQVTNELFGVPSRVILVAGIFLAAAPFTLTLFRRVPLPALLPPLVLVFFLYPIFTPYGFPFSRDPVFVYQFSQTLTATGAWVPTNGVTLQAIVYSYYPGAAIFNVEASALTFVPLAGTFLWSTELFRFLVIPPTIYALASRVFNPKSAPLAVLLYATVPSIEMNIPTQQDFAVTFFLVTVACLAFLVRPGPDEAGPLRLTVAMSTGMVIVSHHVSTYLLLGYLAAIVLLPRVLWGRGAFPSARTPVVFARTVAMALLWVALVAWPVIQAQSGILASNFAALFHPGPGATAIPGASFPTYQIVWIGLTMTAMAGISVLTLLEARRKADQSFVTISILSVLLLGILSIPFLSTGFSFLALRQFEFTGVFLAPVGAWWISSRLASSRNGPLRAALPLVSVPVWAHQVAGSTLRPIPHRWRRPALAIVLVGLLVTGGALVPLSTRDQFAAPSEELIDSPLLINASAHYAALWAGTYLSHSHSIWGDMLAYTALGGFGDFRLVWDPYPLFNGTGFTPDVVQRLHLGSYVVTDALMTRAFGPPVFPGPPSDQPPTPITPADLQKFLNPRYFAPLFSNSVFTIYVIVAIPPAS